MPNITRQVLVEDFYATTITGANVPATGDFTVTVATPPVNPKGWIIFSPTDSGLRERCYYHSVSGSVISVYGINRFWPKEHLIGATVQINDISNIFNYLSEITSSIFYVEKLGGLDVTIWGWPFLKDNLCISVWDTNLTLTNNATNYIYYKWSTNEIKSAISDSAAVADSGIVVSEVITASSLVTSVSPRNYKVCTFTIEKWDTGDTAGPWIDWATGATGATWPVWATGDTGDTWPTGATGSVSSPWVEQDYSDIIKPVTWATVVYDDGASTITITNPSSLQSDVLIFRETGMEYQDSLGNIIAFTTYSGTYSATGTRSMTYSGIVVDGTTGWQTISEWRWVYQNSINNFYNTEVFRGDVIFKRSPSFPYYDTTPSGTVCTFDANDWGKQKITISTAWTYTLNFSNLKYWANYEFAIVCTHSTGTVTIDEWTISTSGSIASYYTVWGTTWVTYPLTLTNWVHLFVWDVFTTAIHIVYSGKSVAF